MSWIPSDLQVINYRLKLHQVDSYSLPSFREGVEKGASLSERESYFPLRKK